MVTGARLRGGEKWLVVAGKRQNLAKESEVAVGKFSTPLAARPRTAGARWDGTGASRRATGASRKAAGATRNGAGES